MRMSDNNGLTIIFVFSCYIFFDYKFFGFSVEIFTIVIALQVAFILLAFSDFGAYLLRLVLGSHELNLEEQEKLLPLFEEVYEEVRKEYPKVSGEIKLYIDSDMNINAYAVGSNTITITRGAYLSLRDAEIKGIFAHEFAHIIHGDTFLLLVLLIGNSIGGFLVFLWYILKGIVHLICGEDGKGWASLVSSGSALLLNGVFVIVELLLLINQRQNEYQADEYAYTIGYGRNLTLALYTLERLDTGGNMSIMERIKSSHPHIKERINRLEKMIK